MLRGQMLPNGSKSSNYKTKLCENFLKGACTFGDRCHFAHGETEQRIYLLNDSRRPEATRLQAALELSRDPRVTQQERWDLAMSRIPPVNNLLELDN